MGFSLISRKSVPRSNYQKPFPPFLVINGSYAFNDVVLDFIDKHFSVIGMLKYGVGREHRVLIRFDFASLD